MVVMLLGGLYAQCVRMGRLCRRLGHPGASSVHLEPSVKPLLTGRSALAVKLGSTRQGVVQSIQHRACPVQAANTRSWWGYPCARPVLPGRTGLASGPHDQQNASDVRLGHTPPGNRNPPPLSVLAAPPAWQAYTPSKFVPVPPTQDAKIVPFAPVLTPRSTVGVPGPSVGLVFAVTPCRLAAQVFTGLDVFSCHRGNVRGVEAVPMGSIP